MSKDTRFKPGQSGNPGGRAKGMARLVRELCEGDMPAMIRAQIAIALGTQPKVPDGQGGERELGLVINAKDMTKAFEALRDTGWGKPRQTIDGEVSVGASPEHLAFLAALQMTPEERRKAMADRLAEVAAEDDEALADAPPSDDDGDD